MGALTIRNLDDEVKRALRQRAAERGVSMEQEARDILRIGVAGGVSDTCGADSGKGWYRSIRELVEPHGGFEIDLPPRSAAMREPPSFESG